MQFDLVKPEKRPVADPVDGSAVVSAADCSLIVFDSLFGCKSCGLKGKSFRLKS